MANKSIVRTGEGICKQTGEITEVQFFVAVPGASQYTYAEASMTQGKEDFVSSLKNALHYFNGGPAWNYLGLWDDSQFVKANLSLSLSLSLELRAFDEQMPVIPCCFIERLDRYKIVRGAILGLPSVNLWRSEKGQVVRWVCRWNRTQKLIFNVI